MAPTIHLPPTVTPSRPATWDELVARAVDQGIVSSDQAAQLLGLAAPVHDRGDGANQVRPRVAEALGYVGAALVVVAGIVIAQQFWADLATWAHVTLLAVAAVSLLVAGAAVPGAPGTPIGRLGSFLWALAVVATGATAAVVATDVAGLEEAAMATATCVPALVLALVLWWQRGRALQHLAVLASLLGTSLSVLALVDVALEEWVGLIVWAVGAAWLALAWADLVRPARVGRIAGAAVVLLGPTMTGGPSDRWGVVLGLVTAGVLVAASVPSRETALLGLGVLGLFQFVPRAVFTFVGEELGAPVALLLSGGVLLGVALWIARTRHGPDAGR